MARIKLTVEYDGTRYAGWQIQPNGPSIQAELQVALATILGEPVTVHGAGRTDAGVHARGQVAAFDVPPSLPGPTGRPLKAYWQGLNSLLPEDIAVVKAELAPDDFDPRRHACGKRYVYSLCNRPSRAPLLRRTHWSVHAPLDVEAMRQGARALLGTHDFSAFRASDCEARSPVRTIGRLDVLGERGGALSLVVEGQAFLKHMVRNIAGTLVEVGRGRFPAAWVTEVLQSRDRTRAGPTAPPHGLVLDEVMYGTGPTGDDGDRAEHEPHP